MGNRDTIVWCNNSLYRLNFYHEDKTVPKPLTPLFFTTLRTPGDDFGKVPTFLGTFSHYYCHSNGIFLPPRIEGVFSDPQNGRITFEWNPCKFFNRPVKVTLLRSHFPNILFLTPVSLSFSLRPTRRDFIDQTVYPFPVGIEVPKIKDVVVDPPVALPPPEFLRELHSADKKSPFQVCAGIGLPDNDIFPTLSYHDFFSLTTVKNLNWTAIVKCMVEKYTPFKGTDDPKAGFCDLFTESATHEKSVLLFPGRWSGFDVKAVTALSQVILAATTFKVFVCTPAHPLANKENARELSPLVTGVGLRGYVDEVIFFNGVVGLGENILGNINYKLAENKHTFFFLRMKTFTKFSRQSPPPTDMYFDIAHYTKTRSGGTDPPPHQLAL